MQPPREETNVCYQHIYCKNQANLNLKYIQQIQWIIKSIGVLNWTVCRKMYCIMDYLI